MPAASCRARRTPRRRDAPSPRSAGLCSRGADMEEVLLAETRGAVRLLTLNRPNKLNALNADLIKALSEALRSVQRDDAVAAVVIVGAGRAFCPGMDTS